MGGGPRVVGPGYISGGNIWRIPNVLLHASGVQLYLNANSNSSFTVKRQTKCPTGPLEEVMIFVTLGGHS